MNTNKIAVFLKDLKAAAVLCGADKCRKYLDYVAVELYDSAPNQYRAYATDGHAAIRINRATRPLADGYSRRVLIHKDAIKALKPTKYIDNERVVIEYDTKTNQAVSVAHFEGKWSISLEEKEDFFPLIEKVMGKEERFPESIFLGVNGENIGDFAKAVKILTGDPYFAFFPGKDKCTILPTDSDTWDAPFFEGAVMNAVINGECSIFAKDNAAFAAAVSAIES